MAHLRIDWISQSLQMATSAEVILPETGDLKRAKVVYLLHGLSDNCTGWCRYTAVERYARNYGVAVVMPEVQRSFYWDTASGMNYFRYIHEELPLLCARYFGLCTAPENSFIMGLSMGGYGAMKCVLTTPDRYAGCGSFSGAFRITDSALRGVLARRELEAIVGEKARDGSDLFTLLQEGKPLPPIYLSCGEEDALYPVNRELAAALEEAGADLRFDHRPGVHSWDFWDRSVSDCFDHFFSTEKAPGQTPAPAD